MLKRSYTNEEVNALLSTVEATFGASLQKAEEELLTKSEAKSETAEPVEEKAEELTKAEGEECEVDEELEKAYREMSKGEQKAHMDMLKRAMGDEASEMHKSEEFETLKKSQEELQKENEELKKSLEAQKEDLNKLVAALSKRVTAVPPQKSVTELATIRKSEETSTPEFSKQEITHILTKKAQEKTLQKSDREAINKFYKTGSADLTLIQHLLK